MPTRMQERLLLLRKLQRLRVTKRTRTNMGPKASIVPHAHRKILLRLSAARVELVDIRTPVTTKSSPTKKIPMKLQRSLRSGRGLDYI